MRDNEWLENRLDRIWQDHFLDIPKHNEVRIHFGRKARTRLGSIRRLRKCDTEITITGFFQSELVPEYIVDLTIAHELCHYAHGFFSPLPQLYKHPHEGKIIDKELYKRNFGEAIKMQKTWLKEKWPEVVNELQPQTPATKTRRKITRRRYLKVGPLRFLIQ